MVPGRGPDRPEERPRSPVGQARNAAQTARRPAIRQRLSVRRDLSCSRCRGGSGLPYADTDMMQLHLNEISRNVAEGAHAVRLLDRAGWHTTSKLDVPATSRRSSCPRARRSSTRSRTSGSISARTGSQTPRSKTTRRSSTPHAKRGESSSLSPKQSHPSECATGLTSVSRHDLWYESRLLKRSLRLGSELVGVIFCGWMRRVFEVFA